MKYIEPKYTFNLNFKIDERILSILSAHLITRGKMIQPLWNTLYHCLNGYHCFKGQRCFRWYFQSFLEKTSKLVKWTLKHHVSIFDFEWCSMYKLRANIEVLGWIITVSKNSFHQYFTSSLGESFLSWLLPCFMEFTNIAVY